MVLGGGAVSYERGTPVSSKARFRAFLVPRRGLDDVPEVREAGRRGLLVFERNLS